MHNIPLTCTSRKIVGRTSAHVFWNSTNIIIRTQSVKWWTQTVTVQPTSRCSPCDGTSGSYPAEPWFLCSGPTLWSSRSEARSPTAKQSWRNTRGWRVPASCRLQDAAQDRFQLPRHSTVFQVVTRRIGCSFKDGVVERKKKKKRWTMTWRRRKAEENMLGSACVLESKYCSWRRQIPIDFLLITQPNILQLFPPPHTHNCVMSVPENRLLMRVINYLWGSFRLMRLIQENRDFQQH